MPDAGWPGQAVPQHAADRVQVRLERGPGHSCTVLQHSGGEWTGPGTRPGLTAVAPQAAFDHAYSVGILRVKTGLDFSGHIQAVETEGEEAGEREGDGEWGHVALRTRIMRMIYTGIYEISL